MAYFDCIVGGSGKGNTLVVTCADDLAGATITCTNGTKTYTKTCPSTAPYEVTFYGLEAGTWTVSATVSGNTYTTTVVITDYEAELGGFNWKTWVDLSENYTSSDFTDLDDLLSDETAIRELMTIHACVDYLADIATTSADVETIIGNDLCAKWINLRDYALDTLYANTIIADYMDTADKYFYGEWIITDSTTTPVTWGAKGNVPVMTSNSAPYGSVMGALSSSYPAYYAFDNNPSTKAVYSASSSSAPIYIGYVFTNPICVKAISWRANIDSPQLPPTAIQLEGSNDGTTWKNIGSQITNIPADTERHIQKYDNNKYYRYLRCACTDRQYGSYWYIQFSELQFYGRELSVSVPTMTSNTTPYGEVNSSTIYSSNFPAWKAFNKTNSGETDSWIAAGSAVDKWISYHFASPIVVKLVTVQNRNYNGDANGRIHTFYLQGSDTGNSDDWHDIGSLMDRGNDANHANYLTTHDYSSNDTSYSYLRVLVKSTYRNNAYYAGAGEIGFYGVDYTEREFEEGTNKKWLYDHGVELTTIQAISSDTKKEPSQLYWKNTTTQADNTLDGFFLGSVDFTSYNLLRFKLGNYLGYGGYQSRGASVLIDSTNATSSVTILGSVGIYPGSTVMPNDFGIVTSSINQSGYVCVGDANSCTITTMGISVKELWLE